MTYGHFEEGHFPKIGKMRNPLIPYREMVKRRYAGLTLSRLEAATALHLRCARYSREEVEDEIQRHGLPLPLPQTLRQSLSISSVFWTTHLERKRYFGDRSKRLGKPEIAKVNKEAEIIEYYMKSSKEAGMSYSAARQSYKMCDS